MTAPAAPVAAGDPTPPAGQGPARLARPVPVPLTSFVGRSAELADLTGAVTSSRLVTALGPGGVGKTRLATALAGAASGRWRDGAWFVDLVPVTDEALVAAAVSRTLGLTDPPGRSAEDSVLTHLADRKALIVLDNCEYVVSGVAVFVERVLGTCPGITVLATSQARLLLPFERVFTVPGLSLPHDDAVGDAVSLFVERATQAGAPAPAPADHRRIGEICRRLDGIALAIELAAARLPSLGLDGIERGLAERFALLSGGSRVDERHRSLRSTIDWSYELLDDADRALLRQVAVFAAPFTTEAAASVTDLGTRGGDDATATVAAGLGRLAEHSLLVTVPGTASGTPTRHRVLDSIRQYGLARMSEAAPAGATGDGGGDDGGVGNDGDRDGGADELAVVRRRHHRWATREIELLDRRGDVTVAEALARPDAVAAWREDFDRVADDARAALLWAADDGDPADAHALAGPLASTCFTRGLLGEAQRRYEQAAGHAPDPVSAADAMVAAAGAASTRQVGNDALRLWRAAADLAHAGGVRGTAAHALARAAELIMRGPGIIADKPPPGTHAELLDEARTLAGDDARAHTAIETAMAFELDEIDPEALATARRAVASAVALDDPLLESAALDALAAISLGLGDVDAARDASRRRIALLEGVRASAGSAFEITDGFHMASEIALAAGDIAAARRYAETSLRLSYYSEDDHISTSRILKVNALAGELDRVLADGARFRRAWEQAGRPVASNLAGAAYSVAMAHGLRGDDAARADWVDIARALVADPTRLDGCSSGYPPMMDAIVLLHHGDAPAAVRRLETDPADFVNWYTGEWRPWYAALHAEAAVLAGLDAARDRIARARRFAHPNEIVAALLDRAEALLDGDADRLAAVAGTLEDSGCRYQWARSLVLAGGEHAERGRREMAALGAAPMA